MPDFTIRHPDYMRMIHRWLMAFDFWRGGVHVLAPEQSMISGMTVNSDSGGVASQLARKLGDFTWYPAWNRSYLWKNERESIEAFQERCARSVNVPIFQHFINTFVSGVLRFPPDKDELAGEPWIDYWQNIDGIGTDIDAFERQALALALAFGRVHALTDRPYFDEPAISRAQEIMRGDRAYSTLISPIDLVDWKQDSRGNFEWFVIREDRPDTRGPGDKLEISRDQYRVWYPDHWELWIDQSNDRLATGNRFVQVGSGITNGLHLATLWASRDNTIASMQCESPFADVLDFNRHCINDFSEQSEIGRAQAFGILCVPSADDEAIGEIQISPWAAMSFPTGAGAPQYVSPDAALADGKYNRFKGMLDLYRSIGGVSRGVSEVSREERSAETLRIEADTKQNQMQVWLSAVGEFDRQLHEHVAEIEGTTNYPKRSYAQIFDLRSSSSKIQDLTALNSVQVAKSAIPKLAASIIKRIAKDYGIPSSEIEQMAREVANTVEQEPDSKLQSMQGTEDEENDTQGF